MLLKYQDDIARIQGSEAARLLDQVKAELAAAARRLSRAGDALTRPRATRATLSRKRERGGYHRPVSRLREGEGLTGEGAMPTIRADPTGGSSPI